MDEFFDRMMLPQRAGAGAAMATAMVELGLVGHGVIWRHRIRHDTTPT